MENLAINLGLCFVGLFGYSLWSVKKHIANRTFSFKIFWGHNKMFWLWAGLCELLYAMVMAGYPVLENVISKRLIEVMNAASGIDLGIPEEMIKVVVYLTLTWQLSRVVNKSVSDKNKIGKEKQ